MTGRKLNPTQILVALSSLSLPSTRVLAFGGPELPLDLPDLPDLPVSPSLDEIEARLKSKPLPPPLLPVSPNLKRPGRYGGQFIPHHVDRTKRAKAKAARKARKKSRR